MTRKFLPLAWILSLGFLLTGCGSSPHYNYYLLSAQDFPISSADTPTVGVGPIAIPEYLSRGNLVYSLEKNTLQVASADLWAEPLENGVQRVLILNLAGLLNTQGVRSFPWHPGRAPDYGVKINLLQLDTNENEAMMTAEWLVYHPESDAPIIQRISRLQMALSAGTPEQIAATYSTLLLQLSELIAAAITSNRDHESDEHTP